jgi:hypothetical protein
MKPDTVIALAATVIALSAFIVAVWQGIETRNHNRMSVMPRIRLGFVQSEKTPIRLYMLNSGTGPAVIENFLVRRDGKLVVSPNPEMLSGGLAQLGLAGDFFFRILYAGDTLTAGETLDIISVTLEDSTDAKVDILISELRRITVECEYASIYGEKRDARVNALGVPLE